MLSPRSSARPAGAARVGTALHRSAGLLLVLIAVGVGLLGFFDRGLIFHDEILNMVRAREGRVFDYAVRPFFYAPNAVAVRLFGYHPYSLLLMSLISITVCVSLIYSLTKRLYGSAVGFLAGLAYVSNDLLFHLGIRAMPHAHAATALVASVWCFVEARHSRGRRQQFLLALAGFLTLSCVAVHPSAIAYLVAACTWIGCLWLLAGVRPDVVPAGFRRAPIWYGGGVLASLLLLSALFSVYYKSYFESYLGYLALSQGAPEGTPWSFYATKLFNYTRVPLILTFCMVLVASWLRRRSCPNDDVPEQHPLFWPFSMSFLLLGTIGVSSFSEWQYRRILVAFLPLVILTFAFWLGAAHESWRRRFRGRWRHSLVHLALVVIAVSGIKTVAQRVDGYRDGTYSPTHLLMYETMANLDVDRVGYITTSEPWGTKASHVLAAGIDAVRLGSVEEFIAGGPDPRALQDAVAEKRVEYVLLDLGMLPAELSALHVVLREASGQRVYTWRAKREVWRVPAQHRAPKSDLH